MIPFDATNPFPHLNFGSYNYAQAKEHAIQVDLFLGMHCQEIERTLSKDQFQGLPQEAWIGLDIQSFSTPYLEIRTALELLNLKPRDRIVDLGCAYARMGHIIGRHYPEQTFHGFELIPERVKEAQRVLAVFDYPNVQVEERDLLHSSTSEAEHYFIYDFGSNQAIRKCLQDLQNIARLHPIQVIARGRASRAFIQSQHPWLSEVHPPRHYDTFSIYQS